MQEKKGRPGVVGPLILISIGLIFLLNSLGILDWSVWLNLWRLWPVLLIAGGLDLLVGRRSAGGSLLVLLVTLTLLAGGLWLLVAEADGAPAAVSDTIRQPRGDAERAEVFISPGVGRLTIDALPESANLVEGTVQLGKGERAERSFQVTGSQASLRLESSRSSFGPSFGPWHSDRAWDLGLAPGVPLGLQVDLGVGDAGLDLSELTLNDVKVEVGVGRVRVVLPAEGNYRVEIGVGIGSIEVIVPQGLEVHVQSSTALGATRWPAGYTPQDGSYTSPGYARADNRVDLEMSVAIGSPQIRLLEER